VTSGLCDGILCQLFVQFSADLRQIMNMVFTEFRQSAEFRRFFVYRRNSVNNNIRTYEDWNQILLILLLQGSWLYSQPNRVFRPLRIRGPTARHWNEIRHHLGYVLIILCSQTSKTCQFLKLYLVWTFLPSAMDRKFKKPRFNLLKAFQCFDWIKTSPHSCCTMHMHIKLSILFTS